MEGLLEKIALSMEDIRQNQDQTRKMVCEIAARLGLPEEAAGNAERNPVSSVVGTNQRMGQNVKELHPHAAGDSQPRPLAVVETNGSGPDVHGSGDSLQVAAMRQSTKSIHDLLVESEKPSHLPRPDLRQQTLPEATKLMATHILLWRGYPYVMGIIIFLNVVSLGIETQFVIDGKDVQTLFIINQIVFAIYVIDVVLQLVVHGKECFRNTWFMFDLLLVLIHIINIVNYRLLADSRKSRASKFFERLMVIRIFRMMRLLRALRLIKQFRTMWRMTYGLLTCFNTLVSALALIAMALFIFGCLGVDLVTLDDESFTSTDLKEIVNTYFSSLPTTILFLVQFVTMDSIAEVYMPLVKAKPGLAVYFGALLLVVSIALMNLVLSTVVEQALSSAHGDEEMEKKIRRQRIQKMTPILEEIFNNLDKDSKNLLTFGQLMEIDIVTLPADMQECFKLESIADLFALLDVDGSGEVSKEEFIEGVASFLISEEPATSFLTRKLVKLLRVEVRQMSADFASLKSEILQEGSAAHNMFGI